MNWQALSTLVGRFLVGVIYIASGISKITDYAGTGQLMTSAHMPLVPVLLPAAIVVEVVCGLGIVIGFMTRLSALVLAAYSLAATLIFNQFWTMSGDLGATVMHLFMSTIVMVGACLFIAGVGPGQLAVDSARPRSTVAA